MRPREGTIPSGRATRAAGSAVSLVGVAVFFVVGNAGCSYEVINRKGGSFLAGVPGATTGGSERPQGLGLRGAPTGTGLGGAGGPGGAEGASEAKQIPFAIEHDDGTKTLIFATGRHLLHHIYQTVLANEEDLFVDQVLSESTLAEFRDRGVDPREAFRLLKRHEGEVAKLMNVMPAGEFTPGLYLKPLSPGVMRLEANSLQAKDLAWKGVDMEWDRNGWRLRWLVRTE